MCNGPSFLHFTFLKQTHNTTGPITRTLTYTQEKKGLKRSTSLMEAAPTFVHPLTCVGIDQLCIVHTLEFRHDRPSVIALPRSVLPAGTRCLGTNTYSLEYWRALMMSRTEGKLHTALSGFLNLSCAFKIVVRLKYIYTRSNIYQNHCVYVVPSRP